MHFLDTTMLVGAADRNDQSHSDAKAVLSAVAGGAYGTGIVSDLVLVETATILARRRGPKEATAFVKGLLGSARVRCVFVDAALFDATLDVFQRFGERLSVADSATVAIMRALGCETLFSHDSGFDGVPKILRKSHV